MPPAQRLVILPDVRNSVGVAIIGYVFLIASISYMIALDAWLNIVALFFAVIGALCVLYFWGTRRRPLSLPRIEIDNQGITWLALFYRRSISWPEISGLQEHIRETADGDNHEIRIWLSESRDGSAQERPHFDLDLGCFLDKSGDGSDTACAVADWLNEIRSCAASGGNILNHASAPKHIRCVIA